jgi:hypothetical protein
MGFTFCPRPDTVAQPPGRNSAHGAEAAHALGGDTGVVTTRPGRAVERSSLARGWPAAQEGTPV